MIKKKTDTDLIIVILNWNSPEDTRECVESLLPQLQVGQKIIIVDNGSSDNSVEILHKTFPEIEILKNSLNLGFQGGMNVGIQEAIKQGASSVMLLNCDTIASPLMMRTLINSSPKDASIVSPGIYFASNHNVLCSTGGTINPVFLDIIHRKKITDFNSPLQLEFLPSHAWLVKTEVFKKEGLLDEIFFPLYYDDLDFCLRLKRKGYKLYLIPAAKIYHNVSMSVGGKNSPRERYLMARNSGYYFRKHMHLWQTPIIFVFRLGSGFLWTFRLLFSNNLAAIKTYWTGFFKGWFGKMPKPPIE
ncbi:MAG: glycosyltransferase family 2 protein [Chloroflexota bacterium]